MLLVNEAICIQGLKGWHILSANVIQSSHIYSSRFDRVRFSGLQFFSTCKSHLQNDREEGHFVTVTSLQKKKEKKMKENADERVPQSIIGKK